jgi:hypothetical protein
MPAKTKKTRKAPPAARAAKPATAAKTSQVTKATKAGNAANAKAAAETAPRPVRRSSAELHFTETTIIRGEAVPPDEALPSGATHEIAGHDASGQPILKRKRFSIC